MPRSAVDPGRVRECLPTQLFGGIREQLRQRGGAACHRLSSRLLLPSTVRSAPGADEVDGVADRLDPGRLLLAHPDPVAVLELHHQLVEVERVGVEVLPEPGLGLNPLRRAPRARCSGGSRTSVITSSRSIAAIIPYRSAVPEGASRSASRVAPGGRQQLAVRSTAPLAHGAVGEPDRVGDPLGGGAAVRHDGHAAQAQQDRPADGVRVHARTEAAERRAAGAARPRRPSAPTGPRRGPRPATALAVPSRVFSVTLPVNPSVTTTSASPASRSRPSRLPMKRIPSVPVSASCASHDVGAALLLLLADREQSDAGVLHARAPPPRRPSRERRTGSGAGGARRCWRRSPGRGAAGRPSREPGSGPRAPACGRPGRASARTGRRSSSRRWTRR